MDRSINQVYRDPIPLHCLGCVDLADGEAVKPGSFHRAFTNQHHSKLHLTLVVHRLRCPENFFVYFVLSFVSISFIWIGLFTPSVLFSLYNFGSGFIDPRSESGSSIFGWIPIRIQSFRDQKFNKITAEKKFNIFLIKNCKYLSPGLLKGRPSYRRSLQLSKQNIQHFKLIFFYFVGHLCPPGSGSGFRIRIRAWIHWPWLNLNPIWIRIRNTGRWYLKFFLNRPLIPVRQFSE